MADTHATNGDTHIDGLQNKPATDGESAYGASTLMADVEKQRPGPVASGKKRPGNLFDAAIDTSADKSRGLDPVYAAKAQLLSEALLDIGMGRYQWLLLIVTAVGWFLDEFWIASFTVILPSATNEAQFFYTYQNPTDLMISLSAGLALGATIWPLLSNRTGRKQTFTATIVLMGMAGLVGAGMTAFTGLCVVGFVVGFAVGGNQAVGAMYLIESLPASHAWLVAAQGAAWGLGRLVVYAVGWAFVELWTCGTGPDEESTASTFGNAKRQHDGSGSSGSTSSSTSSSTSASSCHYVSNKGWRYAWWCFGCITLFLYLCRFAIRARETPSSLLARRRDAEAVQVVRDIAHANGQITWLSEAAFARVDSSLITEEEDLPSTSFTSTSKRQFLGAAATGLRSLAASTRGFLGLAALALLWASAGLAFELHAQLLQPYLATKTTFSPVTATTVTTPTLYTHYLAISACAVPGPILASFFLETRLLSRLRTGGLLSLAAGVLMLVSAGVASTGAAVLGFECVLELLRAALVAVLTLWTVELFGAPRRGAGVAMAGLSWRGAGLVAWIVVEYGSGTGSGAAVWFSGALCVVVAGVWCLLPCETWARAVA